MFISTNSDSEQRWQTLAKWGLLSAGGLVLTTAVLYYGGPTLIAGLSSLAAGIASRFKESGQETALSIGQHTRLRHVPSSILSQLQLNMDEFSVAEEQKQELMQSIEAYSRTKEAQDFFKKLGYEEEDDEPTDFEELPLIDYDTKVPRELMDTGSSQSISSVNSTSSNEPPVLNNNRLSASKGAIMLLTTDDLSATDPGGDDASLIFTASDIYHGHFEIASNPGIAVTNFTQQQLIDSEVKFVHDDSMFAPTYRIDIDGQQTSLAATEFSGCIPLEDDYRVNNDTTAHAYSPIPITLKDGRFEVVWIRASGSDDCLAQKFNSDGSRNGSEYRLNAYTGNRRMITTATPLSNGGSIVAWFTMNSGDTDREVYAQFYSANSSQIYPQEIRVNLITSSYQYEPRALDLSDDKVIMAWFSSHLPGPYKNYGQLFTYNGIRIGSEFPISDGNWGSMASGIGAFSDGSFVVVSRSEGGRDGSGYGVFAQRFSLNITRIGPELQVNTYVDGNQFQPKVSVFPDDKSIVVWSSVGQDSLGSEIYGQFFASNHTKLEGEFRINTNTIGDQVLPYPAVIQETVGIVVWQGQGEDADIYGQLIDSNRKKIGGEFKINKYTIGHQGFWYSPSASFSLDHHDHTVARLDNRRFVVVWNSEIPGGNYCVFRRIFLYDKAPVLRRNYLSLKEGQEIILTNDKLSADDPDDEDSKLTFTASNIRYGRFALLGNSSELKSFTQPQIRDGIIRFTHDGGEEPPVFNIRVDDGYLSTFPVPANISFSNVNDMPVLGQNQLMINTGETVKITSVMLSATDSDNTELRFFISNLVHGRFEYTTNPGVEITDFTPQDIEDGIVQFVHDGSSIPPTYMVRVSDGELSTTPTSAFISFNPPSAASNLFSPTSSLEPNKGNNTSAIVGSILGIIGFFAVGGGTAAYVMRRCYRKQNQFEVNIELGKQHPFDDGEIKINVKIDPNLVEFAMHEKLGGGGFGAVFAGTYTRKGKTMPVAIKYSPNTTPDGQRLTMKEVSTAMSLVHQNIVKFYGVVIKEEGCFVVMERCNYSLHDVLHGQNRQQLTWDEVWNIAYQIASGIEFLHGRGFLHRDIKPLNILFKGGDVKVADFDAAKKLADMKHLPPDSAIMREDKSGMTKGGYTLIYASPELIKREVNPKNIERTQKVDVYQFGQLLYETASGKIPFADVANTELALKIINGELPQIPDYCPASLKILIEQCRKYNPDERPTMATVVNILKWIIEECNYNVSEAEVFEKLREAPISNATQRTSTVHYQTPTLACVV